jgi:hypothetical protein
MQRKRNPGIAMRMGRPRISLRASSGLPLFYACCSRFGLFAKGFDGNLSAQTG